MHTETAIHVDTSVLRDSALNRGGQHTDSDTLARARGDVPYRTCFIESNLPHFHNLGNILHLDIGEIQRVFIRHIARRTDG